MLKKLKDCDKEPIFIVKVRQPYKNWMRYWYIEWELVCKEHTKSRCLKVLDNECKYRLLPQWSEEERILRKLYKWF